MKKNIYLPNWFTYQIILVYTEVKAGCRNGKRSSMLAAQKQPIGAQQRPIQRYRHDPIQLHKHFRKVMQRCIFGACGGILSDYFVSNFCWVRPWNIIGNWSIFDAVKMTTWWHCLEQLEKWFASSQVARNAHVKHEHSESDSTFLLELGPTEDIRPSDFLAWILYCHSGQLLKCPKMRVVILCATMGGQHWWECTFLATLLCYQVIVCYYVFVFMDNKLSLSLLHKLMPWSIHCVTMCLAPCYY